MFIELLSESCEEREEFLYWVMMIEPIFEDKFIQISLKFWLSLTSYFSYDKLIGLGMPLIIRSYMGGVCQEIIVMIIKHHTYTHCTFTLYIYVYIVSIYMYI